MNEGRSSGLGLALLALASAALAQDPGWVLQGEGGVVTALVVDPSAR